MRDNKAFDIFFSYGFFGAVRLLIDLLKTRVFFPKSRIVRFPIFIRGKRNIDFGVNLTTGRYCRIEVFPKRNDEINLKLGVNIQINDFVHIAAVKRIEIGDNTLIASKVFISDHNHGSYGVSDPVDCFSGPPAQRPLISKPVSIGRDVWIGENVCILPGVTIGEGAVIGAGSIVTKDIPPHSVAVGNPAKVIRKLHAV